MSESEKGFNWDEFKPYLRDYCDQNLQKKRGRYICPLCRSGAGRRGTSAFSIQPDGLRWSCFSANHDESRSGGDIFDLCMILEDCTKSEAFAKIQELYTGIPAPRLSSVARTKEAEADYWKFFEKASKRIQQTDYMQKRGISLETLQKFLIGYVPNWRHPNAPNQKPSPRIIFPARKGQYTARFAGTSEELEELNQDLPDEYKLPKVAKVGRQENVFGSHAFKESFVFVVEGEIDALSVEEVGFHAVAIGGTSALSALVNDYKQAKSNAFLIVAMDSDEAGNKIGGQLDRELTKNGIPHRVEKGLWGTDCKDANELLIKDKEHFLKALEAAMERAKDNGNEDQDKLKAAAVAAAVNISKSNDIDGGEGKKEKKHLTLDTFKEFCNENGYDFLFDIIKKELRYIGFSEEIYPSLLPNTAPVVLQNELKKRGYIGATIDNICNCMRAMASFKSYNAILDIVEKVKWDGVDRVTQIFDMLKISEEQELSRVLIVKWFKQTYCLLHNPYKKPFSADFCLVFLGRQGVGKTRLFEKLAIDSDYFGEGQSINTDNKDSVIQATSCWICELGEIGSTMKRDLDKLKAFITSTYDEYRPPYARADERHPRHTSFCGTVNNEQFLLDETGSRRWGVIKLSEDLKIDFDQIKNFDSVQLWAQVKELVEKDIENGKTYANCFRLTEDEIKQINERNEEFTKPPAAFEEIKDIIADLENDVTVGHRFISATQFKENHSSLSRFTPVQIGKALQKLGYEVQVKKCNGKTARVYNLPCRIRNF